MPEGDNPTDEDLEREWLLLAQRTVADVFERLKQEIRENPPPPIPPSETQAAVEKFHRDIANAAVRGDEAKTDYFRRRRAGELSEPEPDTPIYHEAQLQAIKAWLEFLPAIEEIAHMFAGTEAVLYGKDESKEWKRNARFEFELQREVDCLRAIRWKINQRLVAREQMLEAEREKRRQEWAS